jgi:hypothetical protein
LVCPNCAAEVRPGQRFCFNCGLALGQSCAECGAPLVDDARFCGQCGTPVPGVDGTATIAAAVAQSSPNGPSTAPAPVAERRVVSVLFADLVGFTTYSEARDAEEVRDLLSRYFDTARNVIALYGGTIEDYDPAGEIYELRHAVERVAAAADAAHGLGFPFLLTARAENHIRGNPDLTDTIARLQAFAEAGADVLYAPGLRSGEEIRTVCEAVSKPVNVLALPGLSLAEIVAAGAQRVSVGGGLTWVAVRALADAATAIRDSGDFSALAGGLPLREWLGD